jgi:hypothetical protein
MAGSAIAAEARAAVLAETGFRCSAGALLRAKIFFVRFFVFVSFLPIVDDITLKPLCLRLLHKIVPSNKGIACNKTLAKLVSGVHKPDNQTTLPPPEALVSEGLLSLCVC